MSMNRWIALAAFAVAGVATFRRSARRQLDKPRAAPEHLQTWEGEGGAVPVGGSRIAAAKPPQNDDLRRAAPDNDAPPLAIGTP